MTTPRVRKVSVKTRRIGVLPAPTPVSPILLMLLLPPGYSLYRLGKIIPAFTRYLSLYLILINLWTCILYRRDKTQSRIIGNRRLSEKSLHLCELAGGWPAAHFSQRLFQHKTRKLTFQVSFWLIVLGHEVLWIWLLWVLLRGSSS